MERAGEGGGERRSRLETEGGIKTHPDQMPGKLISWCPSKLVGIEILEFIPAASVDAESCQIKNTFKHIQI